MSSITTMAAERRIAICIGVEFKDVFVEFPDKYSKEGMQLLIYKDMDVSTAKFICEKLMEESKDMPETGRLKIYDSKGESLLYSAKIENKKISDEYLNWGKEEKE